MDSLPFEILDRILGQLPWNTIITCERISRKFRQVIQRSSTLQYEIELGISGYRDNPSCKLIPRPERIQRLRQLQLAWSFLAFKRPDEVNSTHAILGATRIYEHTQGVFIRNKANTSGIEGLILPSTLSGGGLHKLDTEHLSGRVKDIAMDPLQNLLIVIEEIPTASRGIMEVALKARSLLTDEPHPHAHGFMNVGYHRQPSCYGITIVGTFVVLYVHPKTVYVLNWRTGGIHCRLRRSNIHDVIPISSDHFLVAISPRTLRHDIPSLEIYKWNPESSSLEDDADENNMCIGADLMRRFLFPAMEVAYRVFRIRCRSDPAPFRYDDLLRAGSSDNTTSMPRVHPFCRPFQIDELPRLIAIHCNTTGQYGSPSRQFIMFVRSSTLLSSTLPMQPMEENSEANIIPTIAASDWAQYTRIVFDIHFRQNWVCNIYGERYAYLEQSESDPQGYHLHVLDFNERSISKLANRSSKQLSQKSAVSIYGINNSTDETSKDSTRKTTVVQGPSQVDFNEGLEYGAQMPMLASTWFNFWRTANIDCGVIIDDEKIIIVEQRTSKATSADGDENYSNGESTSLVPQIFNKRGSRTILNCFEPDLEQKLNAKRQSYEENINFLKNVQAQ